MLQTARAQFEHPVPNFGYGRDRAAQPVERIGQLPPGVGRSFPKQVQDRIGRQQEQDRPQAGHQNQDENQRYDGDVGGKGRQRTNQKSVLEKFVFCYESHVFDPILRFVVM